MTKDGKFVAVHDTTLKRTCGVDKSPEDMTEAEIRKLKIISGNGYSKYKNDPKANKIAFLDEYLDVCKEKGMVPVIEIKMEYTTSGRVSDSRMQGVVEDDLQKLSDTVETKMDGGQYMFIAYDFDTMVEMRKIVKDMPNVKLQHVTNDANAGMINYYYKRGIALDCNYEKISDATLEKFLDSKVLVNLWTVDNEEKVWDFIGKKVDYITTNKKLW